MCQRISKNLYGLDQMRKGYQRLKYLTDLRKIEFITRECLHNDLSMIEWTNKELGQIESYDK